jgi:NAD(P)-dependent dehydrogenase (short-subunit alcohol dehydrogenase family)
MTPPAKHDKSDCRTAKAEDSHAEERHRHRGRERRGPSCRESTARGWLQGHARRPPPEQLEETASGAGDAALVVPTDVTDEPSVRALFAQTAETFGRLDLLFNNAGTGAPPVPFEELTLENWQRVVDTNLTGVFLCAREAVRLMKRQDPRGGRIINNGSISAHVPRPQAAAYTATKHAVAGLTKQISLDCRPFDIVCGQVDIGNAATEMTARMKEGVLQPDGSLAPEPTMAVENVAKTVLYMDSLPLDANVLFVTVMANKMPFVGRG